MIRVAVGIRPHVEISIHNNKIIQNKEDDTTVKKHIRLKKNIYPEHV